MLDQSKGTRAIPILEALSLDEDMVPLDCAEIALLRARAEHLLNRESGRKYCESAAKALSASRACESKKTLLRALFESARAGAEIGDEETLLAAYEELKKLVAERAYADLHDAHYAIAFCESALGYAFSAETHIRTALTLIGPDGSVTQLSRIYNGLGAINLQLCKVTEAYDAFSRALQLVNKIGDDSRASTIAANICTGLTMAGKYEEALSFGRYAVEMGGRVPSPLFVTAYSNMVDAYVLTGRPEEARCCIAKAREWFRQDRSLFARLALLVEAAGLELMLGSEESFIEALEYLESELSGGVPYFVHRGVIAKYAARRDGLMNRIDQAFDRVTAVCETFRNECPVAYLDTLAAKAWLETRSTGRSESKQELVKLLDQYDLPGKRATLEREGFLSSLDRC